MGFEIDQFHYLTPRCCIPFHGTEGQSKRVSTCLNLHKIELQMLLKGGAISVTFRALLSN